MAHDISGEHFATQVLQADKPVVIDVYAHWCGPCKQMAPIFEELSQELHDSYYFFKINIDEERDLAIQHSVSSIPTLLFFNKGKLVAREVGYMNKDVLKEKIAEHLG